MSEGTARSALDGERRSGGHAHAPPFTVSPTPAVEGWTARQAPASPHQNPSGPGQAHDGEWPGRRRRAGRPQARGRPSPPPTRTHTPGGRGRESPHCRRRPRPGRRLGPRPVSLGGQCRAVASRASMKIARTRAPARGSPRGGAARRESSARRERRGPAAGGRCGASRGQGHARATAGGCPHHHPRSYAMLMASRSRPPGRAAPPSRR